MKSSSLKENFLLQSSYQLIILGIPLILSPYLTRTLGAEKLGIYTYTYSIAHYFVIFAMLGINRYGQRTVAQTMSNMQRLRSTFWSLSAVHSCFSILAIALYMIFVSVFVKDNIDIYLLQGIYVVSAFFDYTWLFQGLENFRSIVLKNTIIKLSELILIFIFVHGSNDLSKYTAIMVFSVMAGHLVLLPRIFQDIKPVLVTKSECEVHVKPLFILSISVIAVSLYTVFDKTLLGVMIDMESVSYYEQANKIIGVPKMLLGVVTTVLFPRVCKIVEKGNQKELKRVFGLSFSLLSALGVGATTIVIGVAKSFAPLYFGEAFSICGDIMICMAPVIIIVSLGDLVRTQLMISKHRDREFVFCVGLNAIVNIVLSICLIPHIGIYGAVTGSVAAELCGLFVECWICRDEISIVENILLIIPLFIIGLISLIAMNTVKTHMLVSWSSILVQAVVGGIVYMMGATAYFFFHKKFFEKPIGG